MMPRWIVEVFACLGFAAWLMIMGRMIFQVFGAWYRRRLLRKFHEEVGKIGMPELEDEVRGVLRDHLSRTRTGDKS